MSRSSPLEISLETRSVAYLLERGAFPIKRGQGGEPDREVLWGNRLHFWVEFKKPGGDVRPGQKVWEKYLKGIGDTHYFIDNFEALVEVVGRWELIHGPATARRDDVFKKRR